MLLSTSSAKFQAPSLSILHVALNPVTGPWSVMRDLAMAQAASGRYRAVGIGIIAPKDWPQKYADELAQTGLPQYRARTVKTFGTAQFLWQCVQRPPIEEWVDSLLRRSAASHCVVHFHNAWMSGVFLPLRQAEEARVRVVATFHGVNAILDGKPVRRSLHRWMAGRLPRYGARLTSVDRANLPLARTILGLSPDWFTVIPNGVADDPTLRAAPWTGEGEFRVGHLGSITERKGWRLAAEAVLRLRAAGKNVRLLVAGAGDEAEDARTMAEQNPSAVEFLGHINNPRKHLLPRLHALAVMSAHEGLPMSIIEAMSVGLPIMATEVGGIPEAVTHNTSGLLIPRSTKTLIETIRFLHENPAWMSSLSNGAKRIFLERFEINHVLRAYHAVYEQRSI